MRQASVARTSVARNPANAVGSHPDYIMVTWNAMLRHVLPFNQSGWQYGRAVFYGVTARPKLLIKKGSMGSMMDS